MKACPENIVHVMNDYLDGDISSTDEATLKEHLKSCSDCQKLYHELSKTIAFVQSASHIQAPADFVQKTMTRLPKEKKKANVQRWFKQHPLLTAVALFCIMTSAMLFSNFNNDQQFSFTKQPNLVVEGETVVVPEGETVTGDLTVRNGDLRVEGELHGDVTIVNGQYMASSGVITGEIEEIDKAFEWLWYTIKSSVKEAASIFTENGVQTE
ncbi:zf-HC2 domain-containing protein [Planococcus sp. N028]|uniref:Anti-sigma-W factor RsiW n=1 Tax=Planococcus shixiaomingii TaxID=3058393 RepID=A0ABT8N5M9_9BACL|nr:MULTISPECIES: zf-HC2 domain-containing protein [unclassified Planococcus (in: firmicutes)]MDN7243034.1 zf-HC2 domain-containing protein [Planococcus sp. N028]WKA54976.1 zf-HC2 domain-containing protein [Planococcus sp. N022]